MITSLALGVEGHKEHRFVGMFELFNRESVKRSEVHEGGKDRTRFPNFSVIRVLGNYVARLVHFASFQRPVGPRCDITSSQDAITNLITSASRFSSWLPGQLSFQGHDSRQIWGVGLESQMKTESKRKCTFRTGSTLTRIFRLLVSSTSALFLLGGL